MLHTYIIYICMCMKEKNNFDVCHILTLSHLPHVPRSPAAEMRVIHGQHYKAFIIFTRLDMNLQSSSKGPYLICIAQHLYVRTFLGVKRAERRRPLYDTLISCMNIFIRIVWTSPKEINHGSSS